MKRLARLHELAAKRERLALAALGRDVRACDTVRQSMCDLDERASKRYAEIDHEQEQAWQCFVSGTIDYARVIDQQTREAAQALELETLQAQRDEAGTRLEQAERQRQVSRQAYARARRRLTGLQTLAERHRQQADIRSQLLAEEDQPQPPMSWKDLH
ncbi:hypothetical protein [Pseudomonas sp. LRF_L74]|uniref:hypothetical protein n=1 Tax=Pseudomonas sp. LRF_L74 TaxID=3369422 RepID=UPI003F62A035